MEIIFEALKYVGFPAIVAAFSFIIRLEGKVKQNEKDIIELKKKTEDVTSKIDTMFMNITNSISQLSQANIKHDVMLDTINSRLDSLLKRFDSVMERRQRFSDRKED